MLDQLSPKVNSVLSELLFCLLFECFLLVVVRNLDHWVTVATFGVGTESVKIITQLFNQINNLTLPCDVFLVLFSFVYGKDHGVVHFLEGFY